MAKLAETMPTEDADRSALQKILSAKKAVATFWQSAVEVEDRHRASRYTNEATQVQDLIYALRSPRAQWKGLKSVVARRSSKIEQIDAQIVEMQKTRQAMHAEWQTQKAKLDALENQHPELLEELQEDGGPDMLSKQDVRQACKKAGIPMHYFEMLRETLALEDDMDDEEVETVDANAATSGHIFDIYAEIPAASHVDLAAQDEEDQALQQGLDAALSQQQEELGLFSTGGAREDYSDNNENSSRGGRGSTCLPFPRRSVAKPGGAASILKQNTKQAMATKMEERKLKEAAAKQGLAAPVQTTAA